VRTGARAPRAPVVIMALILAVVACGAPQVPSTSPPASGATAAASGAAPSYTPATASSVPAPGHELLGFLPYWEMNDPQIADHVAATPLTTLALFSVTHSSKGAIDTKPMGYQRITGPLGRRLVTEAHGRGTAVELVYTSFGAAKNTKLFESVSLQATVIASLVALVGDLGMDGIDVDIEGLDPTLVPAYGTFVGNLRAAVVSADPHDRISASTGAGGLGAAMAAAAADAGADRVILMGYDYRTGQSQPGATSPLDRSDGGHQSLRTSLDLYAALGVPVERTLLGLPLYGVAWPVAGPVMGAPSTGKGAAWFPRDHVDLLADPAVVPLRDDVEQVDVYLLAPDGMVGTPSAPAGTPASSPQASAPASAATLEPGGTAAPGGSATPGPGWTAIYVDSPATLAPKMSLADDRGLAGAAFWAIGYERGLPGYTRLMESFVKGLALP
jgi:hypothetical protein